MEGLSGKDMNKLIPGKLYIVKDYIVQETNCAARIEKVRYINNIDDEYMSGYIKSGSFILYIGEDKSRWCGTVYHKILYKTQIVYVYIHITVKHYNMFTLEG